MIINIENNIIAICINSKHTYYDVWLCCSNEIATFLSLVIYTILISNNNFR